MSTRSTSTALPIAEYPIWCKGCRSIQRFSSFLTYVDPGCYRVHVQCRLCLQKSTDNYRKHRDDIKTARLAREQVHERVACVCGVTVNVRYRNKHCRSKRHQSVVSLLNIANPSAPAGGLVAVIAAAKGASSASRVPVVTEETQQEVPPVVSNTVRSPYRPSPLRLDESSTSPAAHMPDNSRESTIHASAPAAERKGQTLQEEVEALILAAEQRLTAQQVLHEQRHSLSTSLESSTPHVTTTEVTAATVDSLVVNTADSATLPAYDATPPTQPAQLCGEGTSHA